MVKVTIKITNVSMVKVCSYPNKLDVYVTVINVQRTLIKYKNHNNHIHYKIIKSKLEND